VIFPESRSVALSNARMMIYNISIFLKKFYVSVSRVNLLNACV